MKWKKKEKTIEYYEKASLINSIITGAICILFFLVCEFYCIYALFTSNEEKQYIIIAMLALSVIGILGVFQITSKFREKEKEHNLNTPGTKEYNKNERRYNERLQKIQLKSANHGDLKKEIYTTPLVQILIGFLFVSLLVASLYIIAAVDHAQYTFMYNILFIGLEVGMFIAFVYALLGVRYKEALGMIERFGYDLNQLQKDFMNGKFYRKDFKDFICVGQKNSYYYDGKDLSIIENSQICWIYKSNTVVFNYTNGMYSGSQNNSSMVLALVSGAHYTVPLEDAAYEMFVNLYQMMSLDVAYGHTDYRSRAFYEDPKHFIEAVKEYELQNSNC